MREFLKGWRRKIGVVMLVIACLTMAGWARSLFKSDALTFSAGKYQNHSKHGSQLDVVNGTIFYFVKSELNTLSLSRTSYESSDEEDVQLVKARYKYPQWESADQVLVNPLFANAEWQWCGFGFCTLLSDGEAIERHVFIPYWSITVPLTFISAWLLLSKPHKLTQKKIPEPIPVGGD